MQKLAHQSIIVRCVFFRIFIFPPGVLFMNTLSSYDEVAEYFSVNRRTIQNWIKGIGVSKPIPHIKIGNTVRFKIQDIEAQFTNNKTGD